MWGKQRKLMKFFCPNLNLPEWLKCTMWCAGTFEVQRFMVDHDIDDNGDDDDIM